MNSPPDTPSSKCNTPVALFIYGLPGAGKSTVLTVADELDIPSITMGDVVRKRATAALGNECTSTEIGEWATAQRETHRSTIMAVYTKEEIQTQYPDTDLVIIEGTRSQDEIDVFSDSFTTKTLRINASFTDRLSRVQTRGRDGEGDFTSNDLIARDAREFDWGLGELYTVDSPDFTITNNTSLQSFKNTVETTLNTVA